ncbi:MAG: glycosyltransferase family 2 protein [Oscillospiraceae bacterium]|nr:glycosyltransferase family 2 protein [Oscillospiraceae bacterium]
MKKISIIIPTFNEEENVIPIHAAVKALFLNELKKYEYEILFIDNKSTDLTRERLRQICREDDKTRVIFNAKNFGQFNSPYYGLTQTSGDCAVMLCADFQDPIELIPTLVQEWEKGHKTVCCVKTSSNENRIVRFLRTVYYKIIKRLSSVDQIEHFTGFGLYDKSFIDVLRELDDTMPFLRGIVAELSPDLKIIEYKQARRRAGKTKNNLYTLYDAAMISFTSYTKIGLRLATIFGAIMSFLGLIIAFVYLILKLMFWNNFPGGSIPVLIGVVAFGSVQLFFTGVVGEYILSINTRLMKRPLVIEEERINFNEE